MPPALWASSLALQLLFFPPPTSFLLSPLSSHPTVYSPHTLFTFLYCSPEWVYLSICHLVPFVSPLLQSLNVIYLVDLYLKGFCHCSCTPEVWRSWGSQWAIYPACTWAGCGGRRRSDGLFGGAVRRWVQRQCWDQTTTLKAWKDQKDSVNLKQCFTAPEFLIRPLQ